MIENQKKWRLYKDFNKGKFCFLIGVDNWSIELQKSEFDSLCISLLKLNEQLLGIKDELMDEESISLVLEELPWFIELSDEQDQPDLLPG